MAEPFEATETNWDDQVLNSAVARLGRLLGPSGADLAR